VIEFFDLLIKMVAEGQMVCFTVPGAPVPCARPRVVRQAGRAPRTLMPARTVQYERQVRAAVVRPPGWPLDAQYGLLVQVFRARRAGDWDNFGKSISDGLTGVLWGDDGQVSVAAVAMHDGDPDPRAVVTAWVHR